MDNVWVVVWAMGEVDLLPADLAYNPSYDIQVFSNQADAVFAFAETVDEIMMLNSIEREGELDYYVPGVVVIHGTDMVEVLEKEVL